MKLTQPLRYFKNDYDLIRTPKGFTEMLIESCNSYPYIRGQGWCEPRKLEPKLTFAKHNTGGPSSRLEKKPTMESALRHPSEEGHLG